MDKTFFSKTFVSALITVGWRLVYLLFIVPWDLFVNACTRLAKMRENGALDLMKIKTQWPYLSFIKRVSIDFLYDAMIVLFYVLGPFVALYLMIRGFVEGGFGVGIGAFFSTLVIAYYSSVMWTLCRDMFVLCILPIRKFLSWCSRPAQYLELDNKRSNK
jgi:hypothetical protein